MLSGAGVSNFQVLTRESGGARAFKYTDSPFFGWPPSSEWLVPTYYPERNEDSDLRKASIPRQACPDRANIVRFPCCFIAF